MKNKKTIISIKAPRALKPQTKDEFGYFLAGLIATAIFQNQVMFKLISMLRKGIAYYIKTIIGHGEVSQERARLSVRYRCTHRDGLAEIANLICHKLRHPNKIDQYNTRLAPLLKIKTTLGSVAGLLDNHWLAGFIQGDGSLALILSRQKNKSFKPTMYVHISQKKPDLLKLIQETLGGSMGYRKSQDTYYYTSNSFTNAAKFIKYLDKYQFVGNKFTQYLIWRKAYLPYQEETHLTDNGQLKLITLKSDLTKARAPKLNHLSLDEHIKRSKAKSQRAKNRKENT